MKRVLLDVDGVLGDFHAPTLEFLHQQFGIDVDLLSFPTWDIFQTVGRQYASATEAEWALEGWCSGIPIYDGAQDGVRALREVAEVYFVTAQMTHAPLWMWERVQWLKKHFDADDRHIVFTLSKQLVVGDVLVDDKPANVAAWQEAHKDRRAVLWEQPWNSATALPVGTTRTRSWDAVRDLLRSV